MPLVKRIKLLCACKGMKFGLRPDPSPKPGEKPYRSFSTGLAPHLTAAFGDEVDLSQYTTPTDQYDTNSCVGNAIADAFEVLNAIEGLPHVQLSRLFLYSICRGLMDDDGDGKDDLDRDEGTYLSLGLMVVSTFGVCREDLPPEQGGWPYRLDKFQVRPSLKAMRAAIGHKIHSYYRITEEGEERLEQIKVALRAKHPVIFGTEVDRSFPDFQGGHAVGIPMNSIGRHAMVIVGYGSKGFLVKNSWGQYWGDQGFCYVTPEYLTWSRTTDLWVPTKGVGFKP